MLEAAMRTNSTLMPHAALSVLIVAFLTACSTDAPVAPRASSPKPMTSRGARGPDVSYTAIDLGLLPGDNYVSIAWALNDRDQVVGRSWHIQQPGVELGRAFLWTRARKAETGEMIALALPFGIPQTSNALAINDRGVAVGWAQGMFGGQTAVVWNTEVGTPISGEKAVAINNRGYAVIQTGTTASLWTPPGIKGSTTGHVYPLGTFIARAINDGGEIVGSQPGVGAVVWQPNKSGGATGDLVPLGSYSGAATFALDINEKGEIVGYATTGSGDIALLWEPTKLHGTTYTAINLNTLIGATSAIASGINDNGAITGRGGFPSTPAPQLWVWNPGKKHGSAGTLTLLGGGLLPDVAIDKPGPSINNRGDVAYVLNGHATLWRKN
jgi:hypothetical protein